MAKKILKISGMHCAGCVQSVEKAIRKIDSVKEVQVNLAAESATVETTDAEIPMEKIRKAVENSGYQIEENWIRGSFNIEGMHCASCVNNVSESLGKINGVRDVQVNLASEKAFLEYDSTNVDVGDLKEAVSKSGYTLKSGEVERKDKLEEKRSRDRQKLEKAKQHLVWSWVITGPIMVWMAVELIFGIHLTAPWLMEAVMTFAASFVLFVPGRETLSSAWKSGKNLNPNMDLLIGIGTIASLGTGFLALAGFMGLIQFPMHSFSGIAAMIMAFHLTGRYIETKSRGRASDAILKLLTLEAENARVIRDGLEEEISVKDLRPGDVMIIRPGEKIPTDGAVVNGEGSVNESMVTGESMPVLKKKGDEVIGGTINLEGSLRVRAVNVGEDTFLNRVVRLVEEAQGSRVPIQDYADRVTAIFVPIVLVLAVITFVTWMIYPAIFEPIINWADGIIPWVDPQMNVISKAFFAALAVLVIACPCALGLATPTALMVGSGLGAENGILIRKGEAIQRLQEVTQIVFDKTGTLTKGEPVVTNFNILDDERDAGQLLRWLYSVENPSEHPISIAIAAFAKEKNVGLAEVEEFKSHPGMGVTGRVEGVQVIVGNPGLMKKMDMSVPAHIRERQEQLENQGKTVVILAAERKISALIALADTLKEDTVRSIDELKKMGYKTAILTGDNQRVAEAIAAKLGIDHVYASVKPDEKESFIRKLQNQGEVVAMVGDGVNDAPALTRADVGIAIGTGTDIAIESGSIVLIDGKLEAVIRAINLSRETFRKIRQNLFWAYFYNVIMIPVAVVGLMHPVLAEAAMAFSSINVVANSRRLQKKSIKF